MIRWVNTNLYTQTTEVLGILPIPTSICTETRMAEYQPAADHKQKHHFLAEMQGTRKPVLPVHSPAKRNLFHQLMNTSLEFNQPDGPPNWKQAVKLWNRQADMTDGISYKLCQQIFY